MMAETAFDPRVGAAAITAVAALTVWMLTQVVNLWLRIRDRRSLILKSARSLLADLETDQRIGGASTTPEMFDALTDRLIKDPDFVPYVTFERLSDGSAMDMMARIAKLPSRYQSRIKEYFRLSNMVSNILEDMTSERFAKITGDRKKLVLEGLQDRSSRAADACSLAIQSLKDLIRSQESSWRPLE